MKKKHFLLLTLSLIVLGSCQFQAMEADFVVFNANIYTIDKNFSTASVMAVKDGKILAVGHEDLMNQYSTTELIDAKGAFLYPGFYDAHCHFLSYGVGKLKRADLNGTNSFAEVLERVSEHASRNPSEWIFGRGWDQNDWEVKDFPGRDELDKLFPDRPVFLTRIDGHAALVNGEALRRAGITAETSVIGGEVIVSNGAPTGVLIDNAMELVSSLIPENDDDITRAGLLAGQADCFVVGLTSVMDAGLDVSDIMLIDSLQQTGELKMKINAMLSSADTNYVDFMKKGIYKTERLHVNSIKLYADGALGSRGACMIHEYADDPGNHGLIMHADDFYHEVMENAFKYNYQVNTHAIGDSGNRYTLDLYAEFLGGPNDRRWRVEHAQIVHESDFQKFADYNIIPSVQATHATSDMYWAGDRVGTERMKGAYAYNKLLALNGWLPNGTDFPIENISPLYTFYAAVVRKDLNAYPEDGFQMQDALSREDALRSITIWAAKGAFEEAEKGSLEEGKAADFVMLEKDLMKVDESEIPYIKVIGTYINGEAVYSVSE